MNQEDIEVLVFLNRVGVGLLLSFICLVLWVLPEGEFSATHAFKSSGVVIASIGIIGEAVGLFIKFRNEN